MVSKAESVVHKSTIVRVFRAPLPMRLAFATLEHLAPSLGARWAESVWFTLPANKVRGRLSGPEFSVMAPSGRISVQLWGSGPTVYLLHGWAGAASQFEAFVHPLVEAGFQVAAVDAPSHGRSAPGAFGARSSTIPEFTDALTAAIGQFGPAHAVIAHSMGASAVAAALCDGLAARRVVMVAPMASPQRYADRFRLAMGFGPRTQERLMARIQRRVGAPMHHFDVPELGRAVAMPPTLIFHDLDDTMTPVTDSESIAAAWPDSVLKVTSGLGHRRILTDPAVIAATVDFIAD